MAWTVIYKGQCKGCGFAVDLLHEEHGHHEVWTYCPQCERAAIATFQAIHLDQEEAEALFWEQEHPCEGCGQPQKPVQWGACPRCQGELHIHQ